MVNQEYHCRGYNRKWVWAKEVKEVELPKQTYVQHVKDMLFLYRLEKSQSRKTDIQQKADKEILEQYRNKRRILSKTRAFFYFLPQPILAVFLVFFVWYWLCFTYYKIDPDSPDLILAIVFLPLFYLFNATLFVLLRSLIIRKRYSKFTRKHVRFGDNEEKLEVVEFRKVLKSLYPLIWWFGNLYIIVAFISTVILYLIKNKWSWLAIVFILELVILIAYIV